MLVLLFACAQPDPDVLLRKGDLAGAAAAMNPPMDPTAPILRILAARVPRDPTITMRRIEETTAAIDLLDHAPATRTEDVDVPLDRLEDLGAAVEAVAEGTPWMVVGRSETLADKDPWTELGDLPWRNGRLVGFAHTNLGAFGASIDANPPVKLVTVGLEDTTGRVYVFMERREDGWRPVSASNAEAAARLLVAAGSARDYGKEALRARVGGGLLRR